MSDKLFKHDVDSVVNDFILRTGIGLTSEQLQHLQDAVRLGIANAAFSGSIDSEYARDGLAYIEKNAPQQNS